MAGNSPLVLLIMGAITSFIFGKDDRDRLLHLPGDRPRSAAGESGLDPLAIHMFIFYWGMVSFITPPVALGAFAAAAITRTNQWAVSWKSMPGQRHLFYPFFFVLNPALILHGTWMDIVLSIGAAAIGIVLIAAGLQGWLAGVGDVGRGPGGLARRLAWSLPASAGPCRRRRCSAFRNGIRRWPAPRSPSSWPCPSARAPVRAGSDFTYNLFNHREHPTKKSRGGLRETEQSDFAAIALTVSLPAASIAQDIKLPNTLAWTAYDVGSGGCKPEPSPSATCSRTGSA